MIYASEARLEKTGKVREKYLFLCLDLFLFPASFLFQGLCNLVYIFCEFLAGKLKIQIFEINTECIWKEVSTSSTVKPLLLEKDGFYAHHVTKMVYIAYPWNDFQFKSFQWWRTEYPNESSFLCHRSFQTELSYQLGNKEYYTNKTKEQ